MSRWYALLQSLWARCTNAPDAEKKFVFPLITKPFTWTGSEPNTMELTLYRRWYTDQSTIGELFIEPSKIRECHILEPTSRAGKDPRGLVCIPPGRYRLSMYFSPHFKKEVPILDVPDHDYIEIHPGNWSKDTKDCLLPGVERGTDEVLNSDHAWRQLTNKIQAALVTQPVFISIVNSAEDKV